MASPGNGPGAGGLPAAIRNGRLLSATHHNMHESHDMGNVLAGLPDYPIRHKCMVIWQANGCKHPPKFRYPSSTAPRSQVRQIAESLQISQTVAGAGISGLRAV
jgi:hypothetical protein